MDHDDLPEEKRWVSDGHGLAPFPVSNLERPAPDEYCQNFPPTSRSRFHGTSDERPIGTIMFDSNETGIRGSSVIRHTSEAA
jgi:hypothetical protein